MKNDAPRERGAERTHNVSPSPDPFTRQTPSEIARDIIARDIPVEHKFAVLLSLIDEYSKPTWKDQMLDYYFELLGANVADAGHAIECAESGSKPHQWALDDPDFPALYAVALREVREERARRDAARAHYDRMASALLAATRLMVGERWSAAA